ncbi:hypothetical protein ACFY8N_20725 [Streptomyces collinus]|uniref:hypothetical protein n=1 Tax=Streptomyces collinus TaxID=42684 RepID=UPI003682C2A8
MVVGADDVAAAGHAAIKPWGMAHAGAAAQGLFPLVVAQQERLRVVVQHGVVISEEAAGGGGVDDGALKARGAGGGLDGAPGGRSGEAATGLEVVVEAGDGVGDGADGLDVDQFVDAIAAARGVPLGDQRGAQMAVLDGQGDEPARAAGDVPGQSAAEAPCADRSVRVGRDDLAGQVVAGGFGVGPGDEVLDPHAQRG